MTSRKWRRVALVAGAVVVIGWVAVSAVQLLQARAALRAGGDDLARVRDRASISSLLDPSTRADLDDATAELADAERRLEGPLLAPVRLVPFVGRQVRGAAGLAEAGAAGATAAADALDDLDALAVRSQVAGPDRLATLDELAEVAERTSDELAGLEPGGADGLVGPLADAVDEVADQQAKAVEAADDLARSSRALRTVLRTPCGSLPPTTRSTSHRTRRLDPGRPSAGVVRSSRSLRAPGLR